MILTFPTTKNFLPLPPHHPIQLRAAHDPEMDRIFLVPLIFKIMLWQCCYSKVQDNKRFRHDKWKHEKAEHTCKQRVTGTFSYFSPATGRSVGGPGRAGGRASSSGLLLRLWSQKWWGLKDEVFNSDLSCVVIGFENLYCEEANYTHSTP